MVEKYDDSQPDFGGGTESPAGSGAPGDRGLSDPRSETGDLGSQAQSTGPDGPNDTVETPGSAARSRKGRHLASKGANRRFVPRLKTLVIALLVALPLAAAASVAYATYDYSEEYEGRILPGAKIAGVDLAGMTKAEAIRAVKKALRPEMHRQVTVRWQGHKWKVTPKELGARSDARAAVEAAVDASGEASMLEKAQMKFLGRDLDFDQDVALAYPKKGAFAFIEGLAREFNREPKDAYIDYSTGWVKIVKEQIGRKVNTEASGKSLLGTLRSGRKVASLDVRRPKPEVTKDEFDQVLLLRQGERKLYFYQDGKITHTYTVAVGQPAYPTPTGLYEITLKRYMPTWVNPDPTGWGKGMPAVIPPGTSNPLGVRALNWDAAGIRFHGTESIYSLGTAASHGCVRLSNTDIVELYDMVDVGAPIVSTY
ncbi:MAG: L,D-transpeptidase/peptidoglycan binding protein [Actinomycetota bacterium]|nr:L,D-transpeptidase/peptidoglycan binding protein [Actinomycetota bacterium]